MWMQLLKDSMCRKRTEFELNWLKNYYKYNQGSRAEDIDHMILIKDDGETGISDINKNSSNHFQQTFSVKGTDFNNDAKNRKRRS